MTLQHRDGREQRARRPTPAAMPSSRMPTSRHGSQRICLLRERVEGAELREEVRGASRVRYCGRTCLQATFRAASRPAPPQARRSRASSTARACGTAPRASFATTSRRDLPTPTTACSSAYRHRAPRRRRRTRRGPACSCARAGRVAAPRRRARVRRRTWAGLDARRRDGHVLAPLDIVRRADGHDVALPVVHRAARATSSPRRAAAPVSVPARRLTPRR